MLEHKQRRVPNEVRILANRNGNWLKPDQLVVKINCDAAVGSSCSCIDAINS